jgi:hypothetical protein
VMAKSLFAKTTDEKGGAALKGPEILVRSQPHWCLKAQ